MLYVLSSAPIHSYNYKSYLSNISDMCLLAIKIYKKSPLFVYLLIRHRTLSKEIIYKVSLIQQSVVLVVEAKETYITCQYYQIQSYLYINEYNK